MLAVSDRDWISCRSLIAREAVKIIEPERLSHSIDFLADIKDVIISIV